MSKLKQLVQRFFLIRVSPAAVFELNSNRRYMLGLDSRSISLEDAAALSRNLQELGIKNTVVVFRGNPNEVIKIIKAKATDNTAGREDNG